MEPYLEDLLAAVSLSQRLAWIAIVVYGLALLYSVPRVVRAIRADRGGVGVHTEPGDNPASRRRRVFPGPVVSSQMENQARFMRGLEPRYLFPSLISACWGVLGCVIVVLLALLFLDDVTQWKPWLGSFLFVTYLFLMAMGLFQAHRAFLYSKQADEALIRAEAEYLEAKFH